MLADRVRMGSVKSGNLILYSYGYNSDLWEVGLSSYVSDTNKGVVSKQSDHLLTEVYSDSPNEFSATFSTVNKIDLTNIDVITMLCEKTRFNRWTILAIQNDKTSYNTILKVYAPIEPYTPSTNTLTLDVSSLVGEYYVTVGIMISGAFENHYTKIYEVVLE